MLLLAVGRNDFVPTVKTDAMVRDFGIVDGVVGLSPTAVVALMAITILGSGVVIASGLGVLYLRGPLPRARVEAVGLLWLLGWGLRTILKHGFQLPRPSVEPAPLAGDVGLLPTLIVDAHGFAFPSGHATNATIVFLGLAWASGRRRAYPVAAVAAGAVALSRVGLGVHYTGDVLGGIGLGLFVVAAGVWLYNRFDRLFLPLALVGIVLLAFLGVFLTNLAPRSLAYTAVALAAWLGWRRSDRRAALRG